MSLPYDLALRLKKAGFPDSQHWNEESTIYGATFRVDGYGVPTLEELVDACGGDFSLTHEEGKSWWAHNSAVIDGEFGDYKYYGEGSTPLIAVAHLWLAINEKV